MKKGTGETLKVIFVIIGALVSISALVAVCYTVFKKYFQVTFECDGECGDCDECFADEDEEFEPICCCEDEEEGCCDCEEEEIADAE